jgi:hypothetical protein
MDERTLFHFNTREEEDERYKIRKMKLNNVRDLIYIGEKKSGQNLRPKPHPSPDALAGSVCVMGLRTINKLG